MKRPAKLLITAAALAFFGETDRELALVGYVWYKIIAFDVAVCLGSLIIYIQARIHDAAREVLKKHDHFYED